MVVATTTSVESLCINSIRFLAVDAINKSNSGHPGLPMGTAPMAFALWDRILRHNPKNPKWFNRDRFVLSAGHGCMLLYALLHLTGYDSVTIEDIKQFRQWGSKTPGHPETFETPGVEVTTGPLGQGISNAVGLAIAEAHLAAKFNRPGLNLVDHYTYVLMGDGCNQEGVSSEAASLAGHLGLGKLIALYDDNHITIDGDTSVSFTEDVLKRYESYGWHVQHVAEGNTDVDGIAKAILAAKAVSDKPSLIKITTARRSNGAMAPLKYPRRPMTIGVKPSDVARVPKRNGTPPLLPIAANTPAKPPCLNGCCVANCPRVGMPIFPTTPQTTKAWQPGSIPLTV